MKAVPKDFTDSCIGNRLTSASPVLGDHSYTPNALNQYETITTGNSRTAVGRAPVDWTVLVNDVAASRSGEIFHRSLTATNATAPVWQDVVIRRDTGSPSMTQHFWYAEADFSPGYNTDGILNNHDADGNLTDDGRWTYLWDAENRLIEMETIIDPVTEIPPAGNPYTKLQFVYDWQGRRIARHVWQGGTQASPTFKSSRRWLYDGWNVITEFSAPSATSTTLTRLNTFTWGLDLGDHDGIPRQRAGGVGGLLAQTAVSGGVIERASYDGNGNIVAWTKSNASAPTSRREYDAFGNTLVSEGNSPCTFGFSTKIQDAETGLYYYGYRFYDPVTGRWPSRDPINEKSFWATVGKTEHLKGLITEKLVERLKSAGNRRSRIAAQRQLTAWIEGAADPSQMAESLGLVEGFDYSFVENDPTNSFDKFGLDREIQGTIHQGIALEDWEDIGGKWVSVGATLWNFGPANYFLSVGSVCTMLPVPGMVWTEPTNLEHPKKSTPCQDMWAKMKLSQQAADPDWYIFWGYNCRSWADNYISSGLTIAGLEEGKCCNPDGTVWERN